MPPLAADQTSLPTSRGTTLNPRQARRLHETGSSPPTHTRDGPTKRGRIWVDQTTNCDDRDGAARSDVQPRTGIQAFWQAPVGGIGDYYRGGNAKPCEHGMRFHAGTSVENAEYQF